MRTMRMIVLGLLLAGVMRAAPAQEASRQAEAAPAAGFFGESVQGLSVALLTKGGDGRPVIVLRNDNPGSLTLQSTFAWLLLAESRDVAYYSDKIRLDTLQKEVPGGGEARCPVALDHLQAHPYLKGTKVVDGYPQPPESAQASRPLTDVLARPLRAQAIILVPAMRPVALVRSKAAMLSVAGPTSTQPADLAALLERFRHDAFAARDASDLAAGKGPQAVPVLLQGLHDPSMPDFGQMWLAAALTRIGGEEAADAVISLMDDPREGVRDVIAFHGPTMRQPRVDDAIIKRAGSNRDPLFTAWAARGFAEHGRPVPQGLVLAALGSSEPRARAEVAEVLALSADARDAERLARLFADGQELVRVAAADAVVRHPRQPRSVLAAMVAALDHPGESARSRIVAALSRSAGQQWEYLPDGSAEQNKRVLQQIEAWWKRQK